MRAALLRECKGSFELADLMVDAPGSGEVRVAVRASGLCHTDQAVWHGEIPMPLPTVLGHEVAGVVEQVGEGVSYVAPGDHVVGCLSTFCGCCEHCLTGHPSRCQNLDAVRRPAGAPPRLSLDDTPIGQFAELSGFAEQVLVHERALVKIDPGVPFATAALLGCGVPTGLGAVFNTARPEVGSTAVVIGCGGVGLNVVQALRVCGVARIVAVDPIAAKRELARSFGATASVDPGGADPVAQVREATGGGAHHAFEVVGRPETVRQAFAMLRVGGTCTVVGAIPLGLDAAVPGFELLFEKTLRGTRMGSNRFRIDIPRYLELYQQGRLRFDELVSRRIRLDDIEQGLAEMGGESARTVVEFP